MPKTITLPNVSERRHVHIVNPTAGDGKYLESIRKNVESTGEEMCLTTAKGEAEQLCRDIAGKDPFVHLVIYGGDGTVHEAVNGIMQSGAAQTASFSVIPAGSGNDFSAYANGVAGFRPPDLQKLDVIRVSTGRHYINGLNMGFDAHVVRAADIFKHKKGLRGSAAYISGVVQVLLQKPTFRAQVTLSGAVDLKTGEPLAEEITVEDTFLLCDCANGPFCGGGFKAAPLCDMQDGLMDVLLIQNITRRKFISLVKSYHDGIYITPDGVMDPRFAPYLSYYKCRKVTFATDCPYCLDGEWQDGGQTVTAEICPGAVWYAAL